jgi:predicted transglutaminase-like cysteine proteinase
MLRFIMWVLILATTAGTYLLTSSDPKLTKYRTQLEKTLGIHREVLSSEALQRSAIAYANFARKSEHLAPIQSDPDMQTWLEATSEAAIAQDLDGLATAAQTQMPRYLEIVATRVTGENEDDISGQLLEFLSQHPSRAQLTHLSVRPVASAVKPQAVLVAGHRLENFTPEALSERKTSTFFAICPHCKHQHASKVPPAQRGISLDCPKCERCYGMLAADKEGRFRYANEFLTGYAPPAVFPTDTAPLHTLYTIWGAVVRQCKYVKDTDERMPARDVWQTSLETTTQGQGDCEDSSIVLADWLMQRGLRVRVAVGRYGDMGGHAWCVARVDNIDYLLESTEGQPDPAKPPYVTDIGSRYVPDVLFDRDALYVRSVPKSRWNGDYFSDKDWIRVQPRTMFKPMKLGYAAYAADPPGSLFQVDSAPVMTATSSGDSPPTAGPLLKFVGLKNVPLGAAAWQVSSLPNFTLLPADGPKLVMRLEGTK